LLKARGRARVSEQRKYKRIEFKEPVQYRILDGIPQTAAGTIFFEGTVSCDLSEGGIKFRVEDFIPLKAVVVVVVSLRDQPLLEIEGRVAWVQKIPHAENYLLGLEFVTSRENALAFKKLRHYIDNFFLTNIKR